MTKVCSNCKEKKPVSEFYANGKYVNGTTRYKHRCKSCTSKKPVKGKCPQCGAVRKHNFDLISIEKRGRCVDCYKIWSEKPENDPDNKKFTIEYTFTERSWTTIYAPSEQEAKDQFNEDYGDEYEIDDVREEKK